jgi:predicted  nucleic acid-binding Zn-ribbon protein
VVKKELTGEEINKSLGELKSAYDELKGRTERDEKELQKIVSDICYDKLESLISIYKDPKNKIDESYSDERYSSFEPIFEKNT